ncbi:MAG: hypothetical protein LUF33_05555 [Clostridiales bacterium]|nr:hypothetical protein [Clostridiales bacterium]
MKKFISIATALVMALSLSVTAFAAEVDQDDPNPTDTNTVITTSIDPTYLVSIPADTNITFNQTSTDFGKIELVSAQLDPGYYVQVSAAAGELKNLANETQTIPYALNADGNAFTSEKYYTDGANTPLTIDITQEAWNEAYAGSYQETITFTVAYTNA